MRLPRDIRKAFLTMGPFTKPTLCFTAAKLANSEFRWNIADNLAFQPKSQFPKTVLGDAKYSNMVSTTRTAPGRWESYFRLLNTASC